MPPRPPVISTASRVTLGLTWGARVVHGTCGTPEAWYPCPYLLRPGQAALSLLGTSARKRLASVTRPYSTGPRDGPINTRADYKVGHRVVGSVQGC